MTSHQVQFYDSDAFLVKTVFDFIEPALQAGEAVIVIATRAHLDLLQALGGAAAGAERSDGRDHCIFLEAHETLAALMVDGQLDEQRCIDVVGGLVRQISDNGSRRVSAFGETVALLYAQGKVAAAARLEELWDTLAQQHRLSLLCAYPMSAFPDEGHRHAFACICAAHSRVNPIESLGDAADEPHALHRTIALLQQQANALEAELRRRQDELTLASQGARIAVMAPEPAPLQSLASHEGGAPPTGRSHAAVRAHRPARLPLGGDGATSFLTVEAAAGQLRLSRPHVLKLIAEQRFRDVVRHDDGALLIPVNEVNRVARELRV